MGSTTSSITLRRDWRELVSKLSGHVTVDGNRPQGDVVVELHNSAGDVVDQVRVDEDGAYRYHLSPARWYLRAWDAHGHGARAEVVIAADEDELCDLELKREGGGSR